MSDRQGPSTQVHDLLEDYCRVRLRAILNTQINDAISAKPTACTFPHQHVVDCDSVQAVGLSSEPASFMQPWRWIEQPFNCHMFAFDYTLVQLRCLVSGMVPKFLSHA